MKLNCRHVQLQNETSFFNANEDAYGALSVTGYTVSYTTSLIAFDKSSPSIYTVIQLPTKNLEAWRDANSHLYGKIMRIVNGNIEEL
jgi:hypothetical protein